jgi:hypothetical protein
MRSTTTIPCRSRRNAGRDAQAAPAPSSLPSRCNSPSKKYRRGGVATVPPSIPSITVAAVNAANATAVAAANSRRSMEFPSALIADVSEPVSSTLPDGALAFSFANIMPTVVLASTAKFARPEAVAADVSIATAAAYSTLGGTTMARAEAEAADAAVTTVVSANLATEAADVAVATAASGNLTAAQAAAHYLPSAPTDAPTAMAPTASAAAVSSVVAAVDPKKGGVSGLIASVFFMKYIMNS